MSLLMLEAVANNSRVDREEKVIRGAAVIRKGKVNDSRAWQITDKTLNQIVELGNAKTGGIKARFDHPSKTRSAMGAYLGAWKNFYRDGDTVRADLHISNAAFNTPNGDIGSYVLDLADEAPEHFGNSISADFAEDFDGIELSLSKLKAIDVVDDPAGTDNGMFSTQQSFEAELSELINRHFTESEEEAAGKLRAFLSTHYHERSSGMSEQETPQEENQVVETQETEAVELSADTESIKEQVRKEERERATRITSLCELSGCPDKAAQLINGGFDYSEAKDLVTTLLSNKNAMLSEDNSDGNKPKEPEDPDAKYRAQYQADKEMMGGNLSVSEDDYIASLKRSEAGGVV